MFSADNDALQSQYTEFEKHDSICQRGIPCSRHDNMLIPQLEISVIWWNPFIKFISLNTYLRSWEGVEETLPSLYSTLHLWENYNLYLFTCFGTGWWFWESLSVFPFTLLMRRIITAPHTVCLSGTRVYHVHLEPSFSYIGRILIVICVWFIYSLSSTWQTLKCVAF